MVALNITVMEAERVGNRRPRGDYRQLVDLDSEVEVWGSGQIS